MTRLTARTAFLLSALPGILLALPSPSRAERADRDQPVLLEADRMQVDDLKKVQTYSGHVILNQGTLQIRADRLVVTQDELGFQHGTAVGAPARFRQKRDASPDYVEGEGERIEYDARSEKVRLINRAYIVSGGDEVRGQTIVYDSLTEKYVVEGGKPAAGGDGRVRAVIQPKNKGADAAPAQPATPKAR